MSTIYAVDRQLVDDSYAEVRSAVLASLPEEAVEHLKEAAFDFREALAARFGPDAIQNEGEMDMAIPLPGFSEGSPHVHPLVGEIEYIASLLDEATTIRRHLHGMAHVLPVGSCREQQEIFKFLWASAFIAGWRARDRQRNDVAELKKLFEAEAAEEQTENKGEAETH